MYRIAVCDDNAEAASELAAQLKELSEERMLATTIDVYASIEELKTAVQSGHYDLICMETLVGGSNGLDFVRELRERGGDTDVLFVTAHAQYAIMAYAVFPIGYVLKPGGKKRVRPFFAAACMGVVAYGVYFVFALMMDERIALIPALLVAVIVYFIFVIKFRAVTEEELRAIPKGTKLVVAAKRLRLL